MYGFDRAGTLAEVGMAETMTEFRSISKQDRMSRYGTPKETSGASDLYQSESELPKQLPHSEKEDAISNI